MRTLRLSLAGTVMLALCCAAGGVVIGQDDESVGSDVASEVLFDLTIPRSALPEDFVYMPFGRWLAQPGTDTAGSSESVLGNAKLRGRGLMVEGGTWVITSATDAMVWRVAGGESALLPPRQAITLGVGDAVFLPAMAEDPVDRHAVVGFANPGTEVATALSFQTKQAGSGVSWGFPEGLSAEEWERRAHIDLDALQAFDGIDLRVRLSRMTGDPGAAFAVPEAPTLAVYVVEEGDIEQFIDIGDGYTWEWSSGQSLQPQREWPLTIAGTSAATILELTATPLAPAE